MGNGSQLSQLKSALSQAGFSQSSQGTKKRKRVHAQEHDKEKRAAKLDDIHRRLNPFDVKVTKLKHDVGGRKLKGVVGRPAQSKQAGIEQRKKTLLKEYEERGHAGGIVDRRFGENDPTMTPEERMLERFTRERQRSSKNTVFNLEDEEELTHYGQSLSKLDDFDDLGIRDEEGEEGQINQEVVKRTHFGGFEEDEEDNEEEPERKKSKSEVMAEVMAKSKEHKLLRQMEREQGENIRHELDQEFDSLRSLLYAPDPSATSSNAIPLGDRDPESVLRGPSIPVAETIDTYDQRVRELAFDKRARAKDRTKTEEELALEAKEALEEAERRRQKRMLGEDEDSSDDGRSRPRARRQRERGADDLEDDFQPDHSVWDGLGAGLGTESESEDSEGNDSSDNEPGSIGGDEEEQKWSGLEDVDVNAQSSEDEDSEQEDLVGVQKAKPMPKAAKDSELPYTFPCPSSHGEFLDILTDVLNEDVPTVVQRIRALYHPSLGPENKGKLETFMTVIIDHVLYITAPPTPHFSLVSSLLPHLFSLSQAFPVRSAEYFVEKLSLMHRNLKKGLAHGALRLDSKTWPGLAELSFLRTIGVIWPTSDMNHAVISPARLLMGAYLGLCRIRSLHDIASGLFLCTLFLQFEELSRRLVPEAVDFLINAILHLAPHSYKNVGSLPGTFPSPDFRSELCLPLSIDANAARKLSPLKPNPAAILSGIVASEQAKVDLLSLAFDLIRRFADMYKSLEGFIELYTPLYEILLQLDRSKIPESLHRILDALTDTIARLLKFSRQARQPLLLQVHKPIPIPTYIPKFEISKSSYLRHQDPDHDRKEASKLRYLIKQERKGAVRELRKDARFLAAIQQKKQEQNDMEYNTRMKRVMTSLESERAEEKAMEREKKKARKRARGK